MYANAQFGVSRDRIRARPLALYAALLKEFESMAVRDGVLVEGGVPPKQWGGYQDAQFRPRGGGGGGGGGDPRLRRC